MPAPTPSRRRPPTRRGAPLARVALLAGLAAAALPVAGLRAQAPDAADARASAAPAARATAATRPDDAAATAARVRGLVDAFVAAQRFTGVVLVAQHDRVVDLRAWGAADVAGGVPTATDTRYELGSISKWVASVLVLRLVDEGRLALDAPITSYLPEYRADTGARLTLHHLLTHTSGIPNDVVAALRADTVLLRTSLPAAEAVRRYASGDLRFAPGAQFDYSHANWLVVRAIVERVTGRPYAEVARAALWAPLHLRGAGTFTGDFTRETSRAPGAAAHGYATLGDATLGDGATPARPRQVPMPDFMIAAGGAYASAPALLALLNGVYDGALLTPASRAALARVHVPGEDYAYGSRTRLRTLGGRPTPVAWHTGTNGAYKSLAVRVLADGWTVVVLNNTTADLAAMGALADDVLRAVHP